MARQSGEHDEHSDLLRGTLEAMVLRVLAESSDHGYGIGRKIEQALGDAARIEDGSLYPALYRLEDRGLLATEWGTSDNNRRAKFYSLTPAGRKQLRDERSSWEQIVAGMSAALRATPESL